MMTYLRSISALSILLVCLEAKQVLVKSSAGDIYGTTRILFQNTSMEFTEFLGIPYAEAPIGDLRFEKPVRKQRFHSPYHANITANISCPTYRSIVYPWFAKSLFKEDCLLLNIFVPGNMSTRGMKPVMIYIHGGSFVVGSQNSFRAPEMVVISDMILVTLNYRLGVLGFLADSRRGLKGNYGLWDQHMAIQWVHDNIAAFGGDTERVILVGNSAGGGSVLYQALYPGNKGLFRGVIAESGSPVSYWAYTEHPNDAFDTISRQVGCYGSHISNESILSCLRGVPFSFHEVYSDYIKPSLDGEFIRVYPDRLTYEQCFEEAAEVLDSFADVDIIVGVSSNDGGYTVPPLFSYSFTGSKLAHVCKNIRYKDFARKYGNARSVLSEYYRGRQIDLFVKDPDISQTWLNIEKDVTFTVPAIEILRLHSRLAGRGQAFFYEFDHRPSFSMLPTWMKGASHADELPYVFTFASTVMWDFFKISTENISRVVDAKERYLSRGILKHWVQFAKTGDPNVPNEDEKWPEYEPINQRHVVFKLEGGSYMHQGQFYQQDKVRFWQRLIAGWLRNTTSNECVRNALRDIPPLPPSPEDVCVERKSGATFIEPFYLAIIVGAFVSSVVLV